jgi:hypothetical protein
VAIAPMLLFKGYLQNKVCIIFIISWPSEIHPRVHINLARRIKGAAKRFLDSSESIKKVM